MKILKQFAKVLFILSLSGGVGLLFGVLPCYVFPPMGGDYRQWCGFKSAPPHFETQVTIGFLVTMVVSTYLLYKRKSNKKGQSTSAQKLN
jgi:hypothetical protein